MVGEIILFLAVAFGFYMAWSIGANDAANAMGTSVGSKSVSFREAIIIAAIFEFAGAMIAGSSVTDTMRNKIVDPSVFADPAIVGTTEGTTVFMIGMLSALIACAMWIHVAAMLGWPVSTTHSIVGAIAGFGLVAVGPDHIQWTSLAKISGSWLVSPLMGGLVAYLLFRLIRKVIFDSPEPVKAVRRWAPVMVFPVFLVLSLMLILKGLNNLNLEEKYGIGSTETTVISVLAGLLGSAVVGFFTWRMKSEEGEDNEVRFARVERVFRYLQIVTACFVAFAHGSNDVANAIGPLAAIVSVQETANISTKVGVPFWVLAMGAVGIVVGLATYGYKVIETVGVKITEITPSRGFAAEFGAAGTILLGSKLGLPISTTHTVVGAVIGVGFARGMNALNLSIIWSIAKSWVFTVPVAMAMTAIIFVVLRAILM